MKKIVALISALVLVLGVGLFSLANATSTTEPCTPKAAWTETVEHPAVTHVVHTDAVPATAEVWANWSPNHTEGPQDYTPVWPEDSRGTWHIHDKIPPGHEGPDGVYQRDTPGQGNSDWFYRHAGTPGSPATDVVVVDKDAWTETIAHPAVTCDTPTPVVTPTPTPTVELGPVPTVKPKHHKHHVHKHKVHHPVTLPNTGA